MHRWALLGLVAAAFALGTIACGADDDGGSAPSDGLRVASFDFEESELLAELYARGAEAAGVPVVRLGAVGPREIVAPAAEQGHIDLVPEYLGTALRFAGADRTDPDPDSARTELGERLARRGLTVLEASPAEDVNVVVVTEATAERHGLSRTSELAPLASSFRFGGPPECAERELCLLGLRERYDLEFAEFVPQPSLAFTAEALRRGEIDVGLLFSTAAELDAGGLVVLDDDRQLQPAENIVPMVRRDALARWSEQLATALDEVSMSLTTQDLRGLNLRVARGEPIAVVAADWLARRTDLTRPGAPRRGRGTTRPTP